MIFSYQFDGKKQIQKGSGFLKSTGTFSKKMQAISHRIMYRIRSFKFFPVLLIRLKKFATLLPNYWLAETPQAIAPRRLGRQSAERERISEIKQKHLLRAESENFF
jgi:hypothetical protein